MQVRLLAVVGKGDLAFVCLAWVLQDAMHVEGAAGPQGVAKTMHACGEGSLLGVHHFEQLHTRPGIRMV